MRLQDKLFLLRKQNNLSQQEFAEKLDVSRQTISKWELGISIPSIDNLLAVSKLCNVSVDYLIDEKTDMEADSPEAKAAVTYYKLNYRFLLTRIIIIGTIIVIAMVTGYVTHSLVTVTAAVILMISFLIFFFVLRFLLRFLFHKEQTPNRQKGDQNEKNTQI